MALRHVIVRTVAVLLVVLAARPAAALWTCTTVAKRGDIDPLGRPFGTRFDGPAVNHAGDLLFTSRPGGAPPRLYHADPDGTLHVLAAGGQPSPAGAPYGKFFDPSLNDAGDVAFLADLGGGKAVFVGSLAGPFATAAATGLSLPTGGTIARFLSVSDVGAGGDVAMVIRAASGPDGVFVWQRATATLAAVAVEGDATLDGRRFCDGGLLKAGLGDSGAVGLRALTKVDCADPAEPLRNGIFAALPGVGVVTVALQDQPSPIAGGVFRTFYEEPEVNASDRVAFRADVRGVANRTGVFLWDPTTATTSVLAQTAVSGSGAGGTVATIGPERLDDAGRTVFHSRVAGGSTTQAVFRFGAGSEALVLGSGVPVDGFGPGAALRPLGPLGYSRAGDWVAFVARVKNTIPPAASGGVLRCRP